MTKRLGRRDFTSDDKVTEIIDLLRGFEPQECVLSFGT